MRRGDEIELNIEKFADRGKSLAHVDGRVVFVVGAVPGDRVKAKITKLKKNFGEGFITEVLAESPIRTEPRCRYFGTCGGCKWQHVQYQAQLEAKSQSVEEALRHHGGFEHFTVGEPIRSENIYHYRNKMEYSFSSGRWLTDWEIASGEEFDTSFALGLHVPGRFDKVLDIHECHLPSPKVVDVLNGFRAFVISRGWRPWNPRKQTGYLRHLVFRVPEHTDDFMVNLVTSEDDSEKIGAAGAFLQERFPFVTTFVNTVNTGVAQTAFGDYFNTVFGSGVVCDRIGPLSFEIAPNAFFQTNTSQAERLYEAARLYAEPGPEDLLYDLYCGAGTISLYMAPYVKRVVGVELVEEAVENARRNATRNKVTNCSFHSGDLMRMFTPEFVRHNGHPDVLITDPPRAGMHDKVVAQVAELRPERFVYVSCNPMTQARDLKMLSEIYELDEIRAVDLFPQTYHVESVARLRLRK